MNRKRRQALLARRNELLSLGLSEEELPDNMQFDEMRNMTGPELCLETEDVWALTSAVGKMCVGVHGH